MKTDITVTADDRVRLERLVADRNTPAKVVWRARIVLAVRCVPEVGDDQPDYDTAPMMRFLLLGI